MERALSSLAKLGFCAILALGVAAKAQAQDKKVDPTGTWTWSTPGRDGGEPRQSTLKLKLEGEKVTGMLSTPGRQGGQARETTIENGKLKGDEVSFTVTREFGGNKFVSKYTGKISGDTLKGKMAFERDGQSQERDWEAKRATEKK
ncbi:MAG: hypothetical protein HY735_26495 [Verrucomicrobia bacterium]|nr:hypothetical protein [Verrucomicrobiota bacterium]